MKTTINAQYKGRTSTGSSIVIDAVDVNLDVHKMIVWALNHPDGALDLVPRYLQVRAEHETHAEGSGKNHGIEP